MTPWVSGPVRFKLLLLIAGPLLVALGFAAGLPGWIAGDERPVDPEERGRRVARHLEQLLADAARFADAALVSFPPAPGPRPARGALRDRLEGRAILNRDLEFLAWDGRPAEPPPGFADPRAPRWWIRLDGVRTRLLVRAGPDEEGWLSLASFVLDSTLQHERFVDLLPRELRQGVELEVQFSERDSRHAPEDSPRGPDGGATHLIEMTDPAGGRLGTASIRPLPAEHAAPRLRASGSAAASACFLLLLLVLFDWPARVRTTGGLLAAAGTIVLGRFLLILFRVPTVLLSRELGSAHLFGSLEAWGLVASPADLLLTALALYLLCVGLRGYLCRRLAADPPAAAVAAVAALSSTLVVAGGTVTVARNSTAPLLQGEGIWGSPGRTALGLGLVLAALGASELWATVWTLARRGKAGDACRPRRVIVALAFLFLAVGASATLLQLDERLALDRLDSELAPQILEQSARRSIALSAAVRQVNEAYGSRRFEDRPRTPRQEFLAYHFWVRSELFHSGYKSSLDFYGPNGDFLSHFGHDLPLVPDPMEPASGAPAELLVREEIFNPVAAVQQQLLHAEMVVLHDGEPVGIVVGHVLDEPGNLPFLPGAGPYLAALGPGGPPPVAEQFPGGPHYVLYNAQGAVLLSTLAQPPTQDQAQRLAALHRTPLRTRAGEESLVGVALGERDRLHLLLIPDPGVLERLAASVRLSLLGLALLALLALAPRLTSRADLAALAHDLRGAFHRKLLAALLAASVVPLVGLALFLRGYIENRGDAALNESAVRFASAAQRALEDYVATDPELEAEPAIDDGILYWLSRVVGQEIHVYANGALQASSKRELFASGLLAPRLDGRVQRELVLGGRPSMVLESRLGDRLIPVAYAPVRNVDPSLQLVAAVPIVLEQREIAREVDRVVEMILLATVLLVGLLAVAATYLARTVARPVRELVEATGQIAAGDYGTRLRPRTSDEVAELVRGFNSMAEALATQRADLERRREYIETLLRHATTGVISTDPAGRIVTLNPAARELLGAARAKLRPGVRLVEALSAHDSLSPLARACAEDAAPRGEPREIDIEGDPKPRRFRLVRVELPGPSGPPVGTLTLLDDVTELMRSNQLAAWAEMARAIAHEIKNPLTPIQLSTEHLQRLLRDRGVSPSPEVDACLETVIKQVRTLYDIAGEFSAYAKLPDLKREPTDPVAFMRETLSPYRSATLRNVTIEERYEPAGPVSIDGRVLSRAVVNLMENALQAMPEGGRLTVSVEPDPARGAVLLTVGDSGAGLTPEARKRLFEPYFSTKSSGTGLGLAIARRAVEAHQGTIEVESTRGRGTRFRIVLPVPGAD